MSIFLKEYEVLRTNILEDGEDTDSSCKDWIELNLQ